MGGGVVFISLLVRALAWCLQTTVPQCPHTGGGGARRGGGRHDRDRGAGRRRGRRRRWRRGQVRAAPGQRAALSAARLPRALPGLAACHQPARTPLYKHTSMFRNAWCSEADQGGCERARYVRRLLRRASTLHSPRPPAQARGASVAIRVCVHKVTTPHRCAPSVPSNFTKTGKKRLNLGYSTYAVLPKQRHICLCLNEVWSGQDLLL